MNKIHYFFSRNLMSRKKNLIVLSVIILAALAICSVLALDRHEDTATKKQTASSNFTNWLKPNEEIKVGDHRYVSACQLLTPEDVTSIISPFPSEMNINEKYLDASVSETKDSSFQSHTTSCEYYPLVEIRAEQYIDNQRVTNLPYSLKQADPVKLSNAVKSYETAAAKSDSDAATSITATMRESLELYEKNADFTFESKLTTDQTNGIILPAHPTKYIFSMLFDNVVYEINLGSLSVSEDQKKFSDPASIEILEQLQAIYTRAMKRLNDKSLSQAPAPTIIDGDSEKFGSSHILEPCSLLSTELFAKITGSIAQGTVVRSSVEPDITTKRYSSVNPTEPIFPENTCERTSKQNTLTKSTVHTIKIHVQSGDTEDAAIKKLTIAGAIPPKKPNTELKTMAEFAIKRPMPAGGDDYFFTEGPYLVRVNYRIDTHNGTDSSTQYGYASTERYIESINALTKSIETDLEKVK